MTKEELWIEADKYVTTTGNNDFTIDAYIASAEPREKKIQELEAQIEKMKSDVSDEIGFAKNFDELHTYNVLNNLLKRWEIKEND